MLPIETLELCLSFYSHPNISDGISSLFLILIATKYSNSILQYSMQLWKSRKHPREGFCINHKMPTSGQSDEPFPRNQLKTDFQWNDNPEITILTDGRRLCKEKFGPVETPVPDNQSNPIQHQWCCNRGHSKIWNFSPHFVNYDFPSNGFAIKLRFFSKPANREPTFEC